MRQKTSLFAPFAGLAVEIPGDTSLFRVPLVLSGLVAVEREIRTDRWQTRRIRFSKTLQIMVLCSGFIACRACFSMPNML